MASVEVMVKVYHTYRHSWVAVLGEEMPCQGKVGNQVMIHKGVANCRIQANVKISPTKISSKASTAFFKNFAPTNISCYAVVASI